MSTASSSAEATVFGFKLPDIGEGVAEGELLGWKVAVGDTVAEDQPLLEVMTDKVTVEIPSPKAGVVKALNGEVGQVLAVGSVVVELWLEGAAAEGVATMAHHNQAAASSKALVDLPSPLQPKQTPAIAPELTALAQAILEENKPQTAEPSSVKAPIRQAIGCPLQAAAHNGHTPTTIPTLAAPATRRLARDFGVNLAHVQGTGPRGRITPQDVHATAEEATAPTVLPSPSPSPSPVAPVSATSPKATLASGSVSFLEVQAQQPYSGMRRSIGEHLAKVKQSIPEFVLIEAINVTLLEGLRQQAKPQWQAEGLKITLLPFVLKALTKALRRYPQLNARLNPETQRIEQLKPINLGIAVDTGDGLLVPVLPHADTLSLKGLAQSVHQLAQQAREHTLKVEQLQGGTFTVTNVGSVGGLFGIPIINAPEAAILAINKATKAPVVTADNRIEVGTVMHLSLSADHRLIDGALAARFMADIKQSLENPLDLLADA
jgi:pyruvate dehydrogenase E2 component (dihydrolipoamide acetyltransferase)